MQVQHRTISRVLSGLFVMATFIIVAIPGQRVSVASEIAPISLAQATQMKQGGPTAPPGRTAPGALKSKTATVKVVCNGKTKTECCEGISYCGCLYSPMPKKGEEDKPLSCDSSPPK